MKASESSFLWSLSGIFPSLVSFILTVFTFAVHMELFTYVYLKFLKYGNVAALSDLLVDR